MQYIIQYINFMNNMYHDEIVEEITFKTIIELDDSVLLDLKLIIEFNDDEHYDKIIDTVGKYNFNCVRIHNGLDFIAKSYVVDMNMYKQLINRNNKRIKKYDNIIEISLQLFNNSFIENYVGFPLYLFNGELNITTSFFGTYDDTHNYIHDDTYVYYFKCKKYRVKNNMMIKKHSILHNRIIEYKYLNNIFDEYVGTYLYIKYISNTYMYIYSCDKIYDIMSVKQIELINESGEIYTIDNIENYISYEQFYSVDGNKNTYIKISSNYLKWNKYIQIKILPCDDVVRDEYYSFVVEYLGNETHIEIK